MYNLNHNLDLILLNVGFSEHNASWNWANICSPFARIYYVKEGEARIRVEGEMYTLNPNCLYLIPPFTMHDANCDGYFSHFYIHFYERTVNKESVFDKYQFPIEIQADKLDLLLTQRLMDVNPDKFLRHFDPQLYDNPPSFSQYIADNMKISLHAATETQGILYQLIARFIEWMIPKTSNKDKRVNDCLKYIHENIDKYITVAQLANIACITEDHFIRIFNNNMGYTPVRYINLKKIEKAQLLLLTTNIPIGEVAFELSIENISYFNRLFKQHTGKTPGEYRREFSRSEIH